MIISLSIALLLCQSTAFASGTGVGNGRSVACREGEVQYFPVAGGADGQSEMAVTCHNGRFFAPAPPVQPSICRDGDREYWPANADDPQAGNGHFVCRAGRFVPEAGH